ncbi:MAG: twin-arginine translocase subunit TatC [Phycisphaerales bacterium]
MSENREQKFVEMCLGDHLEELRLRLILALVGLALGLGICLFFSQYFLKLLAEPFFSVQKATGLPATLQAITLSEKFMVYMKTALLFGVIFSSPWIFYQIWRFISAGLYENEKKFIYIISPICALLFASGAMFFLLVISPLMIRFFIAFDPGIEGIQDRITFSSYVSFMLLMMLVFGVCFQLPIAIVAANKIGIVTAEMLKKARKFVILGIVIVAGVVTPSPDMISQIALAVPMYILFELGLLFCR